MTLTLSQMHALLPDNTAGDISAQDARDVVEALHETPVDRTPVSPPTSGWSWVNQGSTTETDVGNGRLVLAAPSAGGNNLVGRVRTAPSTPYAIVARVNGIGEIGQFDGWGLCFRESSTGEITFFYYQPNSNTVNDKVVIENWTDHDTFSSSVDDAFYGGIPTWLRIEDDGTDLTFSVSNDGFDASFVEMFTVGRTTFMAGGPDQVGFMTRNDSGARTVTLQSWEAV